MSKRTLYTIVTPLPATITRETAVRTLHNHVEMINLNPLVISSAKTRPPPSAPADEFHCTWYELTDRISYLPGIKGQVSYKACFHDLPRGLQTHVYAPAGLSIKGKWTIGGNELGEPREVLELGLVGVPRDGLYLREDVDMRCNMLMTGFVKKTLKKSHAVLVDRLVVKADLLDDRSDRARLVDRPGMGSASARSSATRVGTSTMAAPGKAHEMPGSPPLMAAPGPQHRVSVSTAGSPGPPYPDDAGVAHSPTVSHRSTSTRSLASSSPVNGGPRVSMPAPIVPGKNVARPMGGAAELPGDFAAQVLVKNQGHVHGQGTSEWSQIPRRDSSLWSGPLRPLSSSPVVKKSSKERFELE